MRVISVLNRVLAGVAAAVLAAATLMVFSEIASRMLTGESIAWTVEVSGYSLLYMTFLGAPYLLEKNRHVTIDLLSGNLGGSSGRVLRTGVNFLGAAVCLYFAWFACVVTVDQYVNGIRVTSVMRPYRYLFTAIVPVSMILLAIQFLAHAIRKEES